jgi:hypothetical protein
MLILDAEQPAMRMRTMLMADFSTTLYRDMAYGFGFAAPPATGNTACPTPNWI